jgi:RNA polymerase sigma-70 factor (ECF subfamily)
LPLAPSRVATEATDAELVSLCRGGDAAAFDALVRRHYRAAYAVAVAVMRNTMDAEDVCQDALMRALERLEECREPERFGAWLGQITRRRALNARDARRVRDADTLLPGHAVDSRDPARDAENDELRSALLEALARLSGMQRAVVLLHDHDGRTHKEIGAIVGCSEGMSQQHLFAARKMLRRHLGEIRNA